MDLGFIIGLTLIPLVIPIVLVVVFLKKSSFGSARLRNNGVPATATVQSVQDTGTLVNYNPVCQATLEVRPQMGSPYVATVKSVVNKFHVGRCLPGSSVQVKVDQANPQKIWIDWSTATPPSSPEGW